MPRKRKGFKSKSLSKRTPYIQRLPTEILCLILGLLEPKDLLKCRAVEKRWDQIILGSTKLWNSIPFPYNPWIELSPSEFKQKIQGPEGFSPYQLATFLNKFSHIHMGQMNLPHEYLEEMWRQFNNRTTHITCLCLEGNDLRFYTIFNLGTIMNTAEVLGLANCVLRNWQLKIIFSLFPLMTHLTKVNLVRVDLTGLEEEDIICAGEVKHLIVSKSGILVSQIKALLKAHYIDHQEESFDLSAKCISRIGTIHRIHIPNLTISDIFEYILNIHSGVIEGGWVVTYNHYKIICKGPNYNSDSDNSCAIYLK